MSKIIICPKCRKACEDFKVVREAKPDTKTIIIRKNYCPECGAFIDKFKFINGVEKGVSFSETSNKFVGVL